MMLALRILLRILLAILREIKTRSKLTIKQDHPLYLRFKIMNRRVCCHNVIFQLNSIIKLLKRTHHRIWLVLKHRAAPRGCYLQARILLSPRKMKASMERIILVTVVRKIRIQISSQWWSKRRSSFRNCPILPWWSLSRPTTLFIPSRKNNSI